MTAPRAKQLGITDEVYIEMLERQGGHCALCPATPKARRLHVDQQWNVVADALPVVVVELEPDVTGDRIQVDRRVRRAADP